MFRFFCLSLALYAFASFQAKADGYSQCMYHCDRQINAIPECKPGESCKPLEFRKIHCPKHCGDTYKKSS